jgi:hypothetical protein
MRLEECPNVWHLAAKHNLIVSDSACVPVFFWWRPHPQLHWHSPTVQQQAHLLRRRRVQEYQFQVHALDRSYYPKFNLQKGKNV